MSSIQELENLVPAWKTKTIAPLKLGTVVDRIQTLKEASFNVACRREIGQKDVFMSLADGRNCGLSCEQMGALYNGDEAYAGARDFQRLTASVAKFLGVPQVVPAHAIESAHHIFDAIAISEGQHVIGNRTLPFVKYQIESHHAAARHIVKDFAKFHECGAGDIDVASAEKIIDDFGVEQIAFLFLHLNCPDASGELAVSLENIKDVRALADKFGLAVVMDGTDVIGNAFRIANGADVPATVKEITSFADVFIFGTADEFLSSLGALVGVADSPIAKKKDYFRLTQSKVVEFEGLHTYGGISGRDLGVMSIGVAEAMDPLHIRQRVAQIRYLIKGLKMAGVPLSQDDSASSVTIDAEAFLPHLKSYHAYALGAAIFTVSGILSLPVAGNTKALRLKLPARAYSRNHLDYVIDSIAQIFKNKEKVPGLFPSGKVETHDALKAFYPESVGSWAILSEMLKIDPEIADPWEIRVVEFVAARSPEERREAAKVAGFNTFLLQMDDGITIDLLTDSGTNAMSVTQWGAMNAAAEAGGDWYEGVKKSVFDIYGFDQTIPTHQGRMAEFILSQVLIRKGDCVPNNMYFTTTKHHQLYAGSVFVDIIIPEAHDSRNTHPFKGNCDIPKLRKLIEFRIDSLGSPRMPYISVAGPVNMAGGQPFSMANIIEIREMIDHYNLRFPSDPILLVFDMTRGLENAQMIKEREEKYKDWPVGEILKSMSSHFDAATMSSKKDHLVNIGGFLALRKGKYTRQLYEKCMRLSVQYDGSAGDTALSQRNLAALAIGIREQINGDYIRTRLRQVRRFGEHLEAEGVPIVRPIGGHAVFVDANLFLADPKTGKCRIPREQYRAQTLATSVFVVSGLRAMERGAVSAGRDKSGKEIFPGLELIRLTIPRRVYLDEQLELAAKQIAALYRNSDNIVGLKMVYEPASLRFFQARFEEV